MEAACHWDQLKYDMPAMPMFPSDHACAAAHSMMSKRSSRSWGLWIEKSPSEPHVPRGSAISSAYPRAHQTTGSGHSTSVCRDRLAMSTSLPSNMSQVTGLCLP
jgi:hypothetical protein